MNADTLLENFEILAEAPGGIDRLRDAILEFATNGHLVERDESELKQKFAPINGPSPIPSNWVWTSLAEIASYGGNGNFSSSDIRSTDWVLDLEDIEKGTSRLIEKVTARERPSKSNKAKFNAGDVLYGKLRPYLDKVLVADSHGYCTTEIVPIVPNQGIDPHWLRISLKSPRFLSYVNAKSYGMKMPRLGTKDALLSIHAVPPLAEQKRIVTKVDELMALCDQLEQQQKHRNNLRTATRKSAIDAISTATKPEELETAWKRINNNWEVIADTPESVDALRKLTLSLATKGKLLSKTERKTNPSNGLPETWVLTPFKEIAHFGMGKTPPTKNPDFWGASNSIMWISISDMKDGETIFQSNKTISLKAKKEVFRREPWPIGTLLMSFKLTIGKMSRLGCPAFFNEAIFAFDSGNKITNEFLFRVLPLISSQANSKGAIKGSTLNSESIGQMQVPIPPIDEQKLIVEKVDELMAFCDQLESELKSRSEVAEKFARSVVNAA